MRLNKYIAASTGLGRRPADTAIAAGRVRVNGAQPQPGQQVDQTDRVTLDSQILTLPAVGMTIIMNKPNGYVVSRNGQGHKTIFDLLPPEYHQLKPVGRLDKDSSGLLLLTDDGQLAHDLTHPSRQKIKIYKLLLAEPLQPLHQQMIGDYGVLLSDGPSKLHLEKLANDPKQWRITMYEGRNRQIRRTFAVLGYDVTTLHRTQFGPYSIDDLTSGNYCAES